MKLTLIALKVALAVAQEIEPEDISLAPLQEYLKPLAEKKQILTEKAYYLNLADHDAEKKLVDEDTLTKCDEDDDCISKRTKSVNPFMTCQKVEITKTRSVKACQHKPVLPQLPGEIVGTVVLTILMALSVMAGIGGGGIVVPMLMAFYSLDTKSSIAISGFTIFTGAITRYIVTWTHEHP